MLSIYIGATLLLTFYLFKRLFSPLQKLPGPWYMSWTSLVTKYHEFTATRRVFVHGLHKKYGPVVLLGPGEVSFAGLEGVKEIYASGGSGYDKTEFYSLFEQFGIRTMFSTLSKKDHSQRKRLLADRYAMTNVMREIPMAVIRERAQAFMDSVAAAASSVDVYVLLHCYALDCVTHFMFSPGGLKSLDSPGDFELMKELSYHQSLQKNLLYYYLPTLAPYFSSFFSPRPSPKANQYVLKMAAQQEAHGYTLIEKLTQKNIPLDQHQAAAECKDHMAAGIDTTGDGLCFLMWELSQPENRQHQERLQDELRTAPAETATDTLPYLDAVIKETLRCAPPIPMSLPRYVPAGGRVIEGYFIPQGTIVSCQPYTVHRFDETVFPDPDRFNPERWLDEKGANERNRLFFAFATGGRGCIGRNLAMLEMKTLLREIYSKYRTTVAADMSGSMEIDDQIIASRPKDQTCKLDFAAI